MNGKPNTGLKVPALLGSVASIILFMGGLTWAHYTYINGAVIATGTVVVVGKPKSVQHPTGGVVEKINVQDGDSVEKNSLLIQLDSTSFLVSLEIYHSRLAEALSRKSRLLAEQAGAEKIDFETKQVLLAKKNDSISRLGQQKLFETRRAVQNSRREQLEEKIAQFRNQIKGVEGLIDSKKDQLSLVQRELKNVRSLNEKGLTTESRVFALQRSQSDLLGQLSEHYSDIASISNSIRDTELGELLRDNQFREQVVTELTEVTNTIEELTQKILSTEKQLERVEIRAPVKGIIHEMKVVTIGGVVAPGATILQIIPRNQGLQFETRVDPTAIDQVFVGQDVKLNLTALNQRTTPELQGRVIGTSPTSVNDPVTGIPFYRVFITAIDAELNQIGEAKLVPGMPVSAFLQTGERSVLSFLTRPFTDQISMAFREQ